MSDIKDKPSTIRKDEPPTTNNHVCTPYESSYSKLFPLHNDVPQNATEKSTENGYATLLPLKNSQFQNAQDSSIAGNFKLSRVSFPQNNTDDTNDYVMAEEKDEVSRLYEPEDL